jgi:GrpB-like predicted nucleotidyltransferase (UPF0157 family)
MNLESPVDTDVIRIIEPCREVFDLINFYKDLVLGALPNAEITLIGSFGIPVCGKQEFDLLVNIGDDNINEAQRKVESFSERFGVGPIVDGEGYCRSKKRFGMICELHIVNSESKQVKRHLRQMERFASDPDLVREYDDLKRSLDGACKEDYRLAKTEFFEKNFEKFN